MVAILLQLDKVDTNENQGKKVHRPQYPKATSSMAATATGDKDDV